MPKTLVRIQQRYDKNSSKYLWSNDEEREVLRNKLNEEGFYVITGVEDCLDVYVIEPRTWWE